MRLITFWMVGLASLLNIVMMKSYDLGRFMNPYASWSGACETWKSSLQNRAGTPVQIAQVGSFPQMKCGEKLVDN